MKYVMGFLFGLTLAGASFANCNQFPQKTGPVDLKVVAHGMNVTVKANFKIMVVDGLKVGQKVTIHSYGQPKFFVDGKQVNVTRESAEVVFESLGYSYIEWTKLATSTLFDRKPVLDSSLRVVGASYGTTIIDPEGVISPFHSECANWEY